MKTQTGGDYYKLKKVMGQDKTMGITSGILVDTGISHL